MIQPDRSDSTFIRGTAIFAAVVTACVYLLGLLLVGLTVSQVGEGADSTPMHQCRYTPNRPQDAQVLGHEVRLIPLNIMCRTTDGRLFNSQVVPAWLNPALAASFAATVVLMAGAVVQAHRRDTARWQAEDERNRESVPPNQ
ncbi:hypothetical protein OG349_00135 [Streptomyces sp. NBC_01317]|uniref:hypothetical protein n=1 Tax=Streptomyces sp. NBC_01317 TaxID=2903822 RepID=UPI002E105BDE|nr:hypothetical protein OG349_00135 [Streptomyces sp. NBC_01317]